MRIRYFCHWNALTGYGRAARDYVCALVAAGAEVEIVEWTTYPTGGTGPGAPGKSPEARYSHLDHLVRPWPAPGDGDADGVVAIYHAQPRLLAHLVETSTLPISDASVAMTTWETSILPESFAAALHDYDQVIVPSTFCANILQKAGITHTHVVPHTFDPEFWKPTPRPTVAQTRLYFYSLGAWSARKNHLAILRAYLHAFTAADDVELRLFSHGADYHQIKSLLARSGIPQADLPALSVSHEPQSELQLREIHHQGDVFVSASRAEGWGLPLFEAAAMGKILITTLHGGQADYLNDKNEPRYAALRTVDCWLVPCFAGLGQPVIRDGQMVGEKATTVPGMTCHQLWAEPDVVHMAERMQGAYGQWRAGNTLATTADRESLVRRFGYDVVACTLMCTLIDTLREIAT